MPGGSPPQEGASWMLKVSNIGPRYTNIEEYTLVYRDHTPGNLCGPYRYYVKTFLLYTTIGAVIAIGGAVIFVKRKKAVL